MGDIRVMLNPKTVALIGATEREGSIGRTILENLFLSDKRKIFPVNPGRKTILGIDCYPDVTSIPEKIDLGIVVTPAITVPDVVESCGKAGVEGLIIISSGFKEFGEEGKELEEKIKHIRKKYGLRIIGPNCLGVIIPAIGLNASFLRANPEPGKIAFISQSGALGTAILDWAVDNYIGFSMFASLGSMIDVDFGDLVDHLGSNPETRSIMLYMEGVGNAKKFMSASRGFARNKPIIIVKPGRYTESAKAALSHTGSMAGDDQVYEAAFKRAGVIRVKEVADLFNAAEVLDSKNLPKGNHLAIITNAGGPGVLATDSLMELGGKLSSLSEKSFSELNSFLPPYWSKSNPIDVLGDADVDRFIKSINVCLEDEGVDGILIIYTPQGKADPDELSRKIAEVMADASKPLITVWMGGRKVAEATKISNQNGIPTYETPEEAVKTYFYMYRYASNLKLLYETPADIPVDQAPPKSNLKALIRKAIKEGRTVLDEEESKRFLGNYGIPTTKPRLSRSIDEAVSIAYNIGYPVVIKISSPDISHKSDVRGVVIGISNEEELRVEYEQMLLRVNERLPQARITGIVVQKMIEKVDYEILLGAKRDNDFGSVILFGRGGVDAEIISDFSIGIPPLNQTLSRIMMEQTKVYKMLKGYRGRKPADMRQLEQIIINFSNLIVDFPEILEIDINPIAISNGVAYALDARIVLDKNSLEINTPHPHLVITPYPTKYVTPWKLLDGTEVILRPISPEDEPLEYEMLSSLSEESLKGRFFQTVNKITHEMLIRFCNIDYDREMAMVAEMKSSDGERMNGILGAPILPQLRHFELKSQEERRFIGIARVIMDSDFKNGEFAVVVHDDFQGKGLGHKLIDMMIGIAQEKGLEKIYGMVLTDNSRMLRACEDMGFSVSHLPDGISMVELDLM
ncbi:MAG: GNAT family N-acetyltransferase [Candidatus Methanoperedens sp.]|nr:GNAT family N-acetyltransferase [Candidatus Methanoperedens sp.]